MSFSISSFKRPFPGALLVAASLLLGLNLLLAIAVERKSGPTRFIDNKESKFLHLARQPGGKGWDIAFIGSSFTKNHISSAHFSGLGKRAYNLGISGRLLGDFPSMVEAALEARARVIVLSLSVEELYRAPQTEFPHLADLRELLRASAGPGEAARHLGRFLLGLHKLHYYREPVYEQGKAWLKKLLPSGGGQRPGGSEGGPGYADQERAAKDCEVFKSAEYARMTVLTCTNGDGIQLGYVGRRAPPAVIELPSSQLHPGALLLLSRVLARVQAAGSRGVVVLQPSSESIRRFDLEELRRKIPAPLIDLSAERFSDLDWCDEGHFNLYGRQKYSASLARALDNSFIR